MPTRNVVLTSRQADFVDQLVSTGRYQNASEVLRAGIRLIEREEAEREAGLTGIAGGRARRHRRHRRRAVRALRLYR